MTTRMARGGYEPLAEDASTSQLALPSASAAALAWPLPTTRRDDAFEEEEEEAYPLTRLDREGEDSEDEDDEAQVGLKGPSGPTPEELSSLPRVSGPIPYQSFLIAIVELAERFSYYGCTIVLANFIQQDLPSGSTTGAGLEGQSGALGLGQRTATALITFNTFFVYTTPLLGAYVADRHWGRFRTVCVASGVALAGHFLLVVCALPENIVRPRRSLGIAVVALMVMGVGTGAIKSNISPLLAEQLTEKEMRVKTLTDGSRVIEDPAWTTSRIFLQFYLMINVGALGGQLSMVYAEKYSGYLTAFLLPSLIFLICPLILYLARKSYVRTPPAGSVLEDAVRLLRFASRGRRGSSESFGERAKPSRTPVGRRPEWMTFGDEWVEELRGAVEACRVFVFFPAFWLTYNQMTNNLTSQAAVLNTHGLPNDLLSNLDPLALIVLIPVCDRFLYPALARWGVPFGSIRKITAGFLAATIAMLWAAFVQHMVYAASECGTMASGKGCAPVDLSIWVQTPSYLLIAVAEILASVSGLEFAYKKAPENMRSVVMSIFLFQSAIGALVGEAFIFLSADPLLEVNYFVMACISCGAGVLFWKSCCHLDQD